eukprot:GILJ01001391.1.p1 GENE.GILJ01001391.1~~GILJ01001391.1.p1  ORF type:complete len:177 (-),score=16.31 GILJ01001391.1:129-659(-)
MLARRLGSQACSLRLLFTRPFASTSGAAAADTRAPRKSTTPPAQLPKWPPAKPRLTKLKTKALVNEIEKEQIAKITSQRPFQIPAFKSGDQLAVTVLLSESTARFQIYKGTCIARKNRGLGSSFTILNIYDSEPVRLTWPLYSPMVRNIEVLKRQNFRRSKLYYLDKKEWNTFKVV